MEDEQIEAVKNWLEPKSVQDIQVFIGFANFYWCFIQGFSRIAAPFISILKTTGSSDLTPKAFGADDNEVVGVGSRANETFKNLSKSKKAKNDESKSSTRSLDIRATGEPIFLTSGANKAFNCLRQAFIKALILQHFNPECHIQIETDAAGYAIGGVLSQLSSCWVDPDDSISSKSDFGQ